MNLARYARGTKQRREDGWNENDQEEDQGYAQHTGGRNAQYLESK